MEQLTTFPPSAASVHENFAPSLDAALCPPASIASEVKRNERNSFFITGLLTDYSSEHIVHRFSPVRQQNASERFY
jgi:hypothetical protein